MKRPPIGRLRTKIPVGTFDAVLSQILNSGTNFALVILLARDQSAESFGNTSVGLATFYIAQGVSRSLGQAAIVASPGRAVSRSQYHTYLGQSLGIGSAGGVLLMLPWLAGWLTGTTVPLMAICLPVLTLADASRMSAFMLGAPRLAVGFDLLWATSLAAGVAVFAPISGTSILLVWVAGALVGAAALLMRRPAASTEQAPARRVRRWQFIAEYLLTASGTHVAAMLIPALGGLAVAAAHRGLLTLFAPLHLVFAGMLPVVLGHIGGLDERQTRSFRGGYIAVFGVLLAAWSLVLVSIPDMWGRALLGDTWQPSRGLVVPYIPFMIGAVIASGNVAILRGKNQMKSALRARAAGAALLLIGMLAGAWLSRGTAFGIIIGISIGNVAAGLTWHAAGGLSLGPGSLRDSPFSAGGDR